MQKIINTFLKNINIKLLIIILFTLLLFGLLIQHTSWLNGPTYWKWPWIKLDALYSFPMLLFATLPFLIGQWLQNRKTVSIIIPLLLVMFTMLLLQFIALGTHCTPFSLNGITWVVENHWITSYFSDAQALNGVEQWLKHFPKQMSSLHLHSQNKPPGPILYYVIMINLFGSSASQVGGILIGVFATLTIPCTYLLNRIIGGSKNGSFYGASFLALCPGLVLFFPTFDQLFPLLISAVIILWVLALKQNHLGYASAFGVALLLMTFFTYSLLVIGIFLALLTLNFLIENPKKHIRCIMIQASMGLSVVVIGYIALWLLTGFDPLATFTAALQNQKHLLTIIKRPYPQTILFDFTDFALGTGWISFILVGFFFIRLRLTSLHNHKLRISIFCLLQILVVGITGIIAGETSRVWIFLMPLLMFPIGEELSHWSIKARTIVFSCLWLLLSAIHQNLLFFF